MMTPYRSPEEPPIFTGQQLAEINRRVDIALKRMLLSFFLTFIGLAFMCLAGWILFNDVGSQRRNARQDTVSWHRFSPLADRPSAPIKRDADTTLIELDAHIDQAEPR